MKAVTVAAKSGEFTADEARKSQFLWREWGISDTVEIRNRPRLQVDQRMSHSFAMTGANSQDCSTFSGYPKN